MELNHNHIPNWVKQIYPVTSEGDGSLKLLVSRGISESVDQVVNFDWTTSDLTAIAGLDYTASGGSASIPIGKRSVEVTIPLINDAIKEAAEMFKVSVFNSTDGSGGEITVTIYDDNDTKKAAPETTVASVQNQEESPTLQPQAQAQNSPPPSFLQQIGNAWNTMLGRVPQGQSSPPPAPQPQNPLPTVVVQGKKSSDESGKQSEQKQGKEKTSSSEQKESPPVPAVVHIGSIVTKVVTTERAFAALRVDGRLSVWGDIQDGENIIDHKIIADVRDVSSSENTLTVSLNDGSSVVLESVTRESEEDGPEDSEKSNDPQEFDAKTFTNGLGTLTLNGDGTLEFEGASGVSMPPEIARELFLTAAEGESVVVVVALSKPLDEDLALSYSVENVSTTDEDYSLPSEARELMIPAGSTFATVTVELLEDEETEEEEELRLVLTPVESETVRIGTGSAVVRVLGED